MLVNEIFLYATYAMPIVWIGVFLWWAAKKKDKVIRDKIATQINSTKKMREHLTKFEEDNIFDRGCYFMLKGDFNDIKFGIHRHNFPQKLARGYVIHCWDKLYKYEWRSVQEIADASIPTDLFLGSSVSLTDSWHKINECVRCRPDNLNERYVYRNENVFAAELSLQEYINMISNNNYFIRSFELSKKEPGYIIKTIDNPNHFYWRSVDDFNEGTQRSLDNNVK